MLRNLYLLGIVILVSTSSISAQVGSGTLKGTLTDSETGEPLPFVNVILKAGDQQVAGGTTDFDGNYTIKPIDPGSYNVTVSYIGYNSKKIEGVVINTSKITFLNIELDPGIRLKEFEVVEYTIPLISKDGGSSGGVVTREDIAKMPGRSATAIAATVGGVQTDNDGDISLRGARTANTYYYIDGIKVRGSTNLPKAAIQQVTVMTGGIPASFGDATGGIIAITTRGASGNYFGSIDILTSGFADEDGNGIGFDRFSRTQIEGVLSGPIIWKKDAEGNKTEPLIGFFVAANYRNFLDGRPTFGNYRLKDGVQERLTNDPLRFRVNGITEEASNSVYIDPNTGEITSATQLVPNVQGISNSDYLRSSDWEEVPASQNDREQGISATMKLDINTAPNFNLSFGGTFDWEKDNLYSYANSLANYANNGEQIDQTWRAYAKFTQTFDDTKGQKEEDLIQNAFYSIMVDYSQRNRDRQDPRHKDNLFNYGYVGKFEILRTPNFTFRSDTALVGYYQEGVRELGVFFTPSDVNTALANYTSDLFNYYDQNGFTVRSFDDILAAHGYINGAAPSDYYGLYNAIGTTYNGYSHFDQDQFRVSGSGSADIGNHALTIGFEFEQYTQRSFSSNPRGLWTQARALANKHLTETDFTSIASRDTVSGSIFYTFDPVISLESQSTFDRNLRIALGLDPNGDDIIQVDALNPEIMRLEMFSASELIREGNNTLVSYYGYDYMGNKLTGSRPTIEDFFTQTDANGDLTHPIGAFEPVYIAGYIMDKFAFDDIIFNVGLRIDRFDANQAVLKDEYVIGDALTVGEIRNVPVGDAYYFGEYPSVAKDDWVIYVDDLNDWTTITGYRSGDTWYNAQGVEISDPSAIASASGIAPLLQEPDAVGIDLTANAFEDYEPQINVMPRIAFSFPISDEAVFFAHYDILTQRPTVGNVMNPVEYLLIQNYGSGNIVNNPNLRPTRTIDYELGFQQVLSKSSSLKISAFYRESRDEIQVRKLVGAFPSDYNTYANYDFGTTKGLTLTYDLRRTGNVTLRAAYTLQFANATGSNSQTSINLVNSGEPNLRIIFPTDRDQRHVFVGTFDFRYAEGQNYNGPVWWGKQVFADAGINIVGHLGSGTPYSQQRRATGEAFINPIGSPQLQGTINGSRLPWSFQVNAQIDKSFTIKMGKEGEKEKTANLTVYFLVNNVFNTKSVQAVYRFTGNPDDDGYLTAPETQPSINTQIDPVSFRQIYALKAATPVNYSLPRTMQLGVRFNF